MTWRGWAAAAAGGLVLLGGAFAAGRYSAPVKVETRTEVKVQRVEVAKEVQVAGPVQVVTRVVERRAPEPPRPAPAGCPSCPACVEKETTITETRGAVTTTRDTASAAERASSTVKIVETSRPAWAIEAGGRWPVRGAQLRPERWEAGVGRRILGPVWLAATVDAQAGNLRGFGEYRAGVRLRVEW